MTSNSFLKTKLKLVSSMSPYLSASFGSRRKACVWLAGLAAHSWESWENTSHGLIYTTNITYFSAHRIPTNTLQFPYIFFFEFFWHIFMNCLQVHCLQGSVLESGWLVSGCWSRTSHAFISAGPWLRLSFIPSDSALFDVNETHSLWLQCTWVQPFVWEGTGRSQCSFESLKLG